MWQLHSLPLRGKTHWLSQPTKASPDTASVLEESPLVTIRVQSINLAVPVLLAASYLVMEMILVFFVGVSVLLHVR